jgi:hypothetical protein
VASVLRGSLAYRGSLYRLRTARTIFHASSTKLFCIQKVVKPKANQPCKYLLIHKEAVRKSRKIICADPGRLALHWTIGRRAGILIAPWGHL